MLIKEVSRPQLKGLECGLLQQETPGVQTLKVGLHSQILQSPLGLIRDTDQVSLSTTESGTGKQKI